MAIVNEAKSHGVDTAGLVEDHSPEATAEELVRLAREAMGRGAKGDHVTAILGLWESFQGEPKDPIGDDTGGSQESSGALPAPSQEPTPARQGAEELVRREGLPVPSELDGDPPEMPRDLTATGDREARRLHSEFNAYLARVNYLIGIERADRESAERLADFHEKRALASTAPQDAAGDKVPQHVRLAQASQDPEARGWRDRAVQHAANLTLLYQLRDIYAGNIDRVSRDWSMRMNEFQVSGSLR